MSWDLSPPPHSPLKDHDVAAHGSRLEGKHVALLITGSIAAYRTPDLIRELRREGASVTAFISQDGLKYVSKDSLEWTSLKPVVTELSFEAEHLSGEQPIDLYLLAPASYNTINKVALGIADSVVTSTLASAIGHLENRKVPLLVVPTMHGSMHQSILIESLTKLQALGVKIIPPRQQNGKDNLPDYEVIVSSVIQSLTAHDLAEKQVLITGGPTPVMLDSIRYISNHATGRLAVEIAKEVYYRGGKPLLLLGRGSVLPPHYLEAMVVNSYEEYKREVLSTLDNQDIDAAIFSAAVADYQPKSIFEGKLPSQRSKQTFEVYPTEKVIQLVTSMHPGLCLVSFKYEEQISHDALLKLGKSRMDDGSKIVVVNRGEEQGPQGEQVAWIMAEKSIPQKAVGKPEIAKCLIDQLANEFS